MFKKKSKSTEPKTIEVGLKSRYKGKGCLHCHTKITASNFAVGHQRNTRIHKIVVICKKCIGKEPLDPLNVIQSLPKYDRPEAKK